MCTITIKNRYLTEEAAKELKKFDERFHIEILANAILIASEEDSIEINEAHIKKAIKRVFVLRHIEIGKVKWFIYISSAVLLSFAFFQISQIINSSQISLWLLPIIVILWIVVYCYIYRDFL